MRFSAGRSWTPGASFIQIRPPPAPQQKLLARFRGISTSVTPRAASTRRGAS